MKEKTSPLTESFFNQVFDPIIIYQIDRTAPFSLDKVTIADANTAYEQVMKKSRADIIGKGFFDVWPQSEAHWGELLRRCIKTRRAAHYEGPSPATDTYLEAVAFNWGSDRVAVIFFDKTEWKKATDALVLSRKKLRELASRLTLSEENTRREIATDIHDRVGYGLVSLLEELRQLESETTAKGKERVHKAMNDVQALINESRSLIFKLSPPALKELGLNPALESLASILLTPQGITWKLVGNEDDIIAKAADDDVCILLFRMTREVLVNVTKHARAQNVTITVRRGKNKIQVMVEDDGIGFDPTQLSEGDMAGHYGLFSIRERLTSLGGSFNIISAPDLGTTIVMTTPRELRGKS